MISRSWAHRGMRRWVRGASEAWRRDDGYATMTGVGIIAAIASLLLVVAAVVSQVAARHEAQVAADLAAVAGAYALATGSGGGLGGGSGSGTGGGSGGAAGGAAGACGEARRVAELNGAELAACREEGRDLVVTATVTTAWAAVAGQVEAAARAGPA